MELKPNMYVRTKDGAIAKAEQIIDNEIHFNIKPIFSDGECLGYNWFYIKDVVKASFDIIDLIEVGDYVNGLKVYGITDYGLQVYMFGDCPEILKENEIETIVTKEQFESMSYKVGE